MWLDCQASGPTLMRSLCEHMSGIECGLPIHRAGPLPLATSFPSSRIAEVDLDWATDFSAHATPTTVLGFKDIHTVLTVINPY
jgi:hypothetical protein